MGRGTGSISDFYIDNNLDPSDPDHMEQFWLAQDGHPGAPTVGAICRAMSERNAPVGALRQHRSVDPAAIALRTLEDRAAAGAASSWPLDESDLDYKAETRGWTKLDTDSSAGAAPMASYRKDGVRLNFWLTTGTVGSYLDHPKQGKSQLFRRDIVMGQADALFDNPRQHTGMGYHRRGSVGDARRGRSRSPQRRSTPKHSRSRSRSRSQEPAGQQTGMVVGWNERRGFGFIKPDAGYGESLDVFCHCSAVMGDNKLHKGEQVVFTLEWDEQRGKHRAAQVSSAAVVQEKAGGIYGGVAGGGGYGRVGGRYGGKYGSGGGYSGAAGGGGCGGITSV